MRTDYEAFIEKKRVEALDSGFVQEDINAALFPFQRDIVKWALKRGRAAIFADTGLGKTAMQLEWAHHVNKHTGRPVLIVAPLCVAQQTVREGLKFDIEVNYCRSQVTTTGGVNITNYEMLDKFTISDFAGVVLDESSILKSHDGKTRTHLIDVCQRVPYRLSCTATPSPNDYMELGNQAEFLGIMSMSEMLAMFFTHDSGETSKWRLKGHGARKFWEWMATWSVAIRRPSDIGYSDERYILPALKIQESIIDSADPFNEGLFPKAAQSLTESRLAKRSSIGDRVQFIADKINASPDEQWLVWCHLNDESAALAKLIHSAQEVRGGDSIDKKEATLTSFTEGKLRVLVTKPSIAGFGMNWQHCHNVAFVGLTHSYEEFYQAIRRCWRFGQQHEVNVAVAVANTEVGVLESIRRKSNQHESMSELMVTHMREAMNKQIKGATVEKTAYERDVLVTDNYTLHLGDCVDVIGEVADGNIDYTIFSPPFASLYVYSNSDYDMGNVKDDAEFASQFKFLVDELLRVTRPGRLLSFHCMNLPTSKQRDGVIGIRDFRGELIRTFVDAGWIYHSEVCIWKDPVTAMQRTKALGLLHKQIKKDSAMSRQGIADYLVTMRKPGENTKPITHTNESFPVEIWQRVASPVWMDINQSRTLNYRAGRENDDERHICPLQLDVIERAMELWSAPGDTVLSPFLGIGSEGYVAVKTGRKFIGAELKRSYWELACRNIAEADKHIDLFDTAAS